jgi:hypothetical protein
MSSVDGMKLCTCEDDLEMDHAKITWRQRGADTP